MKRYVIMLVVSAFFLSACGDEEVKTVEWWKTHDEKRAEFIKECKNDSEKMVTANCQNATKAEFHKKLKSDSGEWESPDITEY